MIKLLPLAGSCLLLGTVSVASSRASEDLLLSASKASGYAADRQAWVLRGDETMHSIPEKFVFEFDGDKFKQVATGPIPDGAGYDDSRCWVTGPAGISHPALLETSESSELVAWVMDGAWPEIKNSLAVEDSPSGKLHLQVVGGVVPATLELDKATSLPETLTYWSSAGTDTWSFSQYKQFGKRKFPTSVTHRFAKQVDTIHIESADPMTASPQASEFEMPKTGASVTTFGDLSKPIEMKQIGGYMFVHPRVDGQDVGWFILDSGADVMCLDPKVANKLGLKTIGTDSTAGVVGVAELSICSGHEFSLGGLSFKNPNFWEFDLGSMASAFKMPVAGICGYDFICRAVLDIRPKDEKIYIHRPDDHPFVDATQFRHIEFSGNTPLLQCSFEGGNKGYFTLDTGSGSTVDFYSPVVKKLHLLDRETSASVTGGAGGSASSHAGQISYFELAGHRFEKPSVVFQSTDKGVFASPYLCGNVGMGFIGEFRIVMDYPRDRIALLPETD